MLSEDNSSEKPSLCFWKLCDLRTFAFSDKQDSAPVKLEEGVPRVLRCLFTSQAFSS
jgi:hypothetical protein